jgi:hypothetical protein
MALLMALTFWSSSRMLCIFGNSEATESGGGGASPLDDKAWGVVAKEQALRCAKTVDRRGDREEAARRRSDFLR